MMSDEAVMQGAARHAIEVRTLDELQDQLSLGAASNIVIKIDVEGAETQVIAGAQETIKNFKPLLLWTLTTFLGSRS